jgi:hypothetical protein
MLRLSDENLATLRAAAAPLDPRDRGSFLELLPRPCAITPIPTAGSFSRAPAGTLRWHFSCHRKVCDFVVPIEDAKMRSHDMIAAGIE